MDRMPLSAASYRIIYYLISFGHHCARRVQGRFAMRIRRYVTHVPRDKPRARGGGGGTGTRDKERDPREEMGDRARRRIRKRFSRSSSKRSAFRAYEFQSDDVLLLSAPRGSRAPIDWPRRPGLSCAIMKIFWAGLNEASLFLRTIGTKGGKRRAKCIDDGGCVSRLLELRFCVILDVYLMFGSL